jgi:hypothetical protein
MTFGFPAPNMFLFILHKCILLSSLLTLSVPDEGHSRNQSFNVECTCWRIFHKRIVRTKLDIYVFINSRCWISCLDLGVLVLRLLNYLPFKYFGFDVPDVGHSRNGLCTLNYISVLFFTFTDNKKCFIHIFLKSFLLF